MNWVDDVIGPPQRVPKADISSGNLSSTRSGEGLTREMSALKLAQWPIYNINSPPLTDAVPQFP